MSFSQNQISAPFTNKAFEKYTYYISQGFNELIMLQANQHLIMYVIHLYRSAENGKTNATEDNDNGTMISKSLWDIKLPFS